MPEPEIDIDRVLFSSDHASLNEAILADVVSALPVVGAIGDFFRAAEANTQRKRVLQMLDLIAEPLPIINILTPTNTLLYLDKTGKIDLKFIEELMQLRPMTKR